MKDRVTLDDLREICRYAKSRTLEPFVEPLNDAMQEFEINALKRRAAFIAQVAQESGEFRYVREIASGAAYDTGAKAVALGNTPEDDDDGERYRGGGLLQITGRANYAACGAALGLDLLSQPELLEGYANAARSAGWFWREHGLNELADRAEFRKITLRINGGLNGYGERLAYYDRALRKLAGTINVYDK